MSDEENTMNGNINTGPVPKTFEYHMKHTKRGSALIFNHEVFANPNEYGKRSGTNLDCERMSQTLTDLHFNVTVYNDLPLAEIMHRMRQASQQDFTDHDCILMVILSHGKEDLKIAAHDSEYSLASVFHYFKDSQCPSLKGKPKLFFIQACQGSAVDPGIELKSNHQHASNSRQEPEFCLKNSFIGCYNVIIPPDFLIAYSTIPGFVSWRNSNGSWFIQTLCDLLNESGKTQDILTLLTSVKRRVATDYCSNTEDKAMDKKLQIPSTITTLTRLLKFTGKDDIASTKRK
ncbi:caspase-like [Bradysia coprophila]|uniref:caspase-like n=1 Tax=Bradysia coprophila TaxID=38358 RepID=UPI00187DC355|nr:caspase-like [Bradysia coprophila]